ncbi:ABC transporter substrate-binding protein [Azospirillum argentinense]
MTRTNSLKLRALGAASMLALALSGAALSGTAYAQDMLKIGVPTAMSGTYADLGNQAKRAVEFAIAEANARGGVAGHKVEAKILDTEAKPDLARKQSERLALEGYKVLTGVIASGEALAIAPMLDRWDALYVATVTKSDKITGDSCVRRAFRVNHQDAQDAAVVNPWLAGRKEQKWAIIGMDGAWGRGSGAGFKEAATANGKSVVAELYPPLGATDYAAYIQQIKASGAEGLWVALAGRDAVSFATQARQFGLLDSVFTAGVSFVTDNTVQAMGETAKGIHGIINYSATLDTPENKSFVAAWAKHYNGDQPSNFEGETYLGMQVIFQAVEKAKSVKPIDIARAMSGGSFDTILGRVAFRPEDNQLILPNYFGHVAETDGKLRPVVTMSFPAEQATPAPSGACKLQKL